MIAIESKLNQDVSNASINDCKIKPSDNELSIMFVYTTQIAQRCVKYNLEPQLKKLFGSLLK